MSASYAYNPSGLRNVKTVGGSTKYFVYNGMNIVYEYSESVADGVAYFYGLNRTHNSEGEIYVYNAHGDVVQLVKDNAVVASYTYDAFGNLTSQIGESDNPFLYCGEYYDAETKTYYLRARYYNPANGRFTQQDAWSFMDASDPLSLNLYTYCCNNPVMYVDPSGHDAILLLYPDAAAHAGHVSALFQDENDTWFFVYWGASGSTKEKVSPFGTNAYMELFELGEGTLDSMTSITDFLREHNAGYLELGKDNGGTNLDWTDGLTDSIYFEGDFSASVAKAKELYNDGVIKEEYNLYINNCMQVSLNLLSQGTFPQHDFSYKVAIARTSAITVPNLAFPELKEFSACTSAYLSAPWYLKAFMQTPFQAAQEVGINSFAELCKNYATSKGVI